MCIISVKKKFSSEKSQKLNIAGSVYQISGHRKETAGLQLSSGVLYSKGFYQSVGFLLLFLLHFPLCLLALLFSIFPGISVNNKVTYKSLMKEHHGKNLAKIGQNCHNFTGTLNLRTPIQALFHLFLCYF